MCKEKNNNLKIIINKDSVSDNDALRKRKTNFSVEPAGTKDYDVRYMTGNKGDDKNK